MSEQRELRSILKSTRVGDLELTPCPLLESATTIAAAAAEMRRESHGSALVCIDGKIAGIFTERDLMRVIASGKEMNGCLADVMTAHPKTVTIEDSLFDVARSMDEGGYRRLPVVDGAGAPVAIIDVKALVHFLVEHFPAAIYNQASHAQQTTKKAEGA